MEEIKKAGCCGGHHHHHEHGGRCDRKNFAPDSALGLLYQFGHRLHHAPKGAVSVENMLGALSPEEQQQLADLLLKAKESWKPFAADEPEKAE